LFARAARPPADQDEGPPILPVLPPKVGQFSQTKVRPLWIDLEAEEPKGDLMGPAPPPAPTAVTPEPDVAPAWTATRAAAGASNRVQQMYDYSTREVWYADNIAVPEKNGGVVITAEYLTHPFQERRVQHHYDDAIRSVLWKRNGPRLPSAEAHHHYKKISSVECRLPPSADYGGAVDVKGMYLNSLQDRPHYQRERHMADYSSMLHFRKDSGWMDTKQKVKHHLEREMLSASEMEQFFANPEAVMYERVDYWNLPK